MPVSRVEIAQQLATTFTGSPVSREELVDAARRSGARPAVVRLLKQLPDGRFREVRDLWLSMPDVPIESGARRTTDR